MSEEWKSDELNTYWWRADGWLVRKVKDGLYGIFHRGEPLIDDDGDQKTSDSPASAMDHVDHNYPS